MASKNTEKACTDKKKPLSSDEGASDYDSQSSEYYSSDEGKSSSDGTDDASRRQYGHLQQDLSDTTNNREPDNSLTSVVLNSTPTLMSTNEPSDALYGILEDIPDTLTLSPLQIHASDETDGCDQFTLPPPSPPSSKQSTQRKRTSSSPHNLREAKRLENLYNPNSKQVNPTNTVLYIGETDPTMLSTVSQSLHTSATPATPATLDPSNTMPVYYQCKTTEWQHRREFHPDRNKISPTGLPRINLFVYAIEANEETTQQRAKQNYKRNMQSLNT